MALRCILTKRNVDKAQLLIQAESGRASVEVAGRAPTTSEVAIQLEIQKAESGPNFNSENPRQCIFHWTHSNECLQFTHVYKYQLHYIFVHLKLDECYQTNLKLLRGKKEKHN